mgnify:CR=1 FL=1
MPDLLSIAEAQRLVLERAEPLPAENVPLEGAARRVLAEPARAEIDLPPFPSSAMDGYAVRADETPGRLRIEARIAAGNPATAALESGQAMGIATGGVVPDGADAVIPIEYVVETMATRSRSAAPSSAGTTFGRAVVTSGRARSWSRPALCSRPQGWGPWRPPGFRRFGARAGRGPPFCQREPSCRPGEPLAAGEIYEANGLILSAQLRAAGAAVELMPAVGDDGPRIGARSSARARRGRRSSPPGACLSARTIVRRVEAELGVEEVFWRVSVKPGKPIAFGVRERTLVFGLPGNPVSALVGFVLFVEPAIRALQGVPDPLPRFDVGRVVAARRRNSERDEARALLASAGQRTGTLLEPLDRTGIAHDRPLGRGRCARVRPRGEGELGDGASVDYLRLE